MGGKGGWVHNQPGGRLGTHLSGVCPIQATICLGLSSLQVINLGFRKTVQEQGNNLIIMSGCNMFTKQQPTKNTPLNKFNNNACCPKTTKTFPVHHRPTRSAPGNWGNWAIKWARYLEQHHVRPTMFVLMSPIIMGWGKGASWEGTK